MAKNAATESALGELHGKVAKVMSTAMDQIEKQQVAFDDADERGVDLTEIVRPEVNASLLSCITKFLSDNKITCNPEDSKELGELEQRLQMKRKRKSIGNVVPLIPEDD